MSGGGGAAQYLPEADLGGISHKGLEKLALEKGVIVEHGGGYHAYLEFDRPIGYNNGKPTNWIRAELSGGVYHGHPFDPTKLPSAVTGR